MTAVAAARHLSVASCVCKEELCFDKASRGSSAERFAAVCIEIQASPSSIVLARESFSRPSAHTAPAAAVFPCCIGALDSLQAWIHGREAQWRGCLRHYLIASTVPAGLLPLVSSRLAAGARCAVSASTLAAHPPLLILLR